MASPFSKLRLAVSCVLIFCSMIVLIPKRPSTHHPMPARSKLWMVKPENMWMEQDRIAGSLSEGRQDREGTRRDKGRLETGVKNRQECQAMFTLDKGGEVWVDDGPYTKLSHQLPPLMESASLSATDPSASVHHGTRLTLTNGSVAYLPCKVRQYSALDLGSCSAKRSSQGKKTWIAFVGDSNGRQKTHTFLNFLPQDFDYVYYTGDIQVSRESFILSVTYHSHRHATFDILGRPKKDKEKYKVKDKDKEKDKERDKDKPLQDDLHPKGPVENPFDEEDIVKSYSRSAMNFSYSQFPLHDSDLSLESYDLRVTLVWAPVASYASFPSLTYRVKVTKFKEWLEEEVIPDVIVLGLGTWFLIQKMGMDELVPYTEAGHFVRPLVSPLTRLARRTHVLWWHQSRYRWFNNESGGDTPWEKMLHKNQFRDSIPFMDAWLWMTAFRDTGMWQWDSTVPFNLANYRECHELWKLGLAEDKIYKSRWWNCNEDHHSSYETNAVEIQMLLNLLCNPYVEEREQYCCSGG